MIILRILLMILILLILIYLYNTFVYWDGVRSSSYGVWSVYGIMGSGKSTLIQRFICENQPKGWKIFSNFNMAYSSKVDPYLIGKYYFPPDSLIQIDEAGVVFSNRNWKNTDPDFVEYLRNARKLHNKIIFYSQSNDLEKRIRDMSSRIYIIKKGGLFSIARGVSSVVDITNNSGDSENSNGGDIIYKYNYIPLLTSGSVIITWLPRYSTLFDTDEVASSKPYFSYNPIEADLSRFTKKYYRSGKRGFVKTRFKTFFVSVYTNLKFKLLKLPVFRAKKRLKSNSDKSIDDYFVLEDITNERK